MKSFLVRGYEKASIIVTSNKSFVDWGEIFNNHVLATAILDRLFHHSTTLNIKGESYMLKEKRKAGMLSPRKEEKKARILSRLCRLKHIETVKTGHFIPEKE